MRSTKPADDLELGADYFNDHEWIRREMIGKDGACCIIGAVSFVVGADDHSHIRLMHADQVFQEYLIEIESPRVSSFGWNDNVCQNKEEAQYMMRRAAAWWREEGAATR